MKRITTSILTLGFLLAASAASAQDNRHEQSGHQGGGGEHSGGEHGAPGGNRDEGHPMGAMGGGNQEHSMQQYAPQGRNGYNASPGYAEHNTRPEFAPQSQGRPEDREAHDQGYHDERGDRDQGYHGAWRDYDAPRQYRDGGYRPPEGYEYRRWRHGDRLPPDYFIPDYWIGNFLAFGLFAPPPDYVWVRVGDDAVLVDRYTGEVIEVEYDIFD